MRSIKSTSGDQDLAASEPNVPVQPTDLLGNDADAGAAQDRAKAQIEADRLAELDAEKNAADAEQRATEFVLDPQDAPKATTEAGDAGVMVQYLGTSDKFVIRGAGPDKADIVAYAGGDPIKVSQEQLDWYRANLVHDRFDVIEDTHIDQENSE
jgi:hypothetical protein